jgi:putative transposase
MGKQYPSNLTDNQYDAILRIIGDKRKRRRSLKEIFDAIFYLLKTGCQWRQLPGDFPAWQSVYYYFRKWSRDGTFKKVHDYLRGLLRRRAGRDTSPSVGIIDSQSVRGTYRGRDRGIDGGKKVKGRKRHIITDTQGLVLAVQVHPANHHDSKAAMGVIRQLKGEFKRMKKIYADVGYRGELKDIVKQELKYTLKITLRSDKSKQFKPLPKRWVVERTFAWWDAYRRLSREYEFKTRYEENMIYLAMIKLMVKRLHN